MPSGTLQFTNTRMDRHTLRLFCGDLRGWAPSERKIYYKTMPDGQKHSIGLGDPLLGRYGQDQGLWRLSRSVRHFWVTATVFEFRQICLHIGQLPQMGHRFH